VRIIKRDFFWALAVSSILLLFGLILHFSYPNTLEFLNSISPILGNILIIVYIPGIVFMVATYLIALIMQEFFLKSDCFDFFASTPSCMDISNPYLFVIISASIIWFLVVLFIRKVITL